VTDLRRKTFERAVKLLAARPRSVAELRERLLRGKNTNEEIVETVIARLRDIHGSDLPAVLVTADRSTEVRAAAAALDVPVINKPLKPAVLRSMMARVRPLASAAE